MGEIRVAIVGVGNCASSLVQGLEYYRNLDRDAPTIPGIMHNLVGGYQISDVKVVAAFDVNQTKVGKDLSEAIYAEPNNTRKFCKVPTLGVKVQRGMTHDGIGRYLKDVIIKSNEPTVHVAQVLKDRQVDLVINYLPVGSEEATKWYVEQAIQAGCGFINCIPVFIASSKYWNSRFTAAALPIIGDDIKSQVGATIVHRVLTALFADRGVRLDRTYQLNVGGNTDFLNMLERDRLESKKISKTQAVTSASNEDLDVKRDVHVGPSDYVPWLEDRKFCFIRMEGTTFGDVPLELDLHLRVWDSPNSAGVVIDAIRLAKIAKDRGMGGALLSPSAYLMKSPPVQMRDEIAREELEKFILE